MVPYCKIVSIGVTVVEGGSKLFASTGAAAAAFQRHWQKLF